MAEKRHEGGVSYHKPGKDYFDQRQLRRHAGVFSLWALGVAAVISGDFSGWNLGFAVGGWGGMLVGTIIIAIMYLGLTYSIAEMSPALPHTGGAYSFARTAFGPWGGFITGIAENIEYVLTPAVIVFFIGSYLTAIFETPAGFQPVWWILGYIIFVGLNARGVELSFKVTVIVTLLAIAILLFFFVSCDAALRLRQIRDEYRRRCFAERRWSCRRAMAPSCRSGDTASSRRCPLRCGFSSPSSSSHSRRKSRPTRSATCQKVSCSACSR